MKALTLYPPYARLIAVGKKRYETRPPSYNYKHRGLLAIHEAQKELDMELVNRLMGASSELQVNDLVVPNKGCIVAIAQLRAVYTMASAADFEPENAAEIGHYRFIENQTPLELTVGDWRAGRKALELTDVQILLEPVPARGYPGLWDVPDEAERQIWSQLGRRVA